MRNPHGRLRLVHVLSALAAGPIHVDAQVLGTNQQIHILHLREHRHCHGRRVDAALTLRLWHALHTLTLNGKHHNHVNPAFGAKRAVGAFAGDLHDGLLDATGEREGGEAPAAAGGVQRQDGPLPILEGAVVLVHVENVFCEERSLRSSGSSTHFQRAILLVFSRDSQHEPNHLQIRRKRNVIRLFDNALFLLQ